MLQRGKDREKDRAENHGPKNWPELVKMLLQLGVPLAGLIMLLTSAFSGRTKWAIRTRANDVSELSREAVRGLPHHCAHINHNMNESDYDDPNNGIYTTIWEHRFQHIDSQRRGVIEGTSRLDNGMTIPANRAAIELLNIGITIFEAVLQERVDDITALEQEYIQGQVLDSALTPDRALRAIVEEKTFFTKQYGHLSPATRQELQRRVKSHIAHLENAHRAQHRTSNGYIQERLFVR